FAVRVLRRLQGHHRRDARRLSRVAPAERRFTEKVTSRRDGKLSSRSPGSPICRKTRRFFNSKASNEVPLRALGIRVLLAIALASSRTRVEVWTSLERRSTAAHPRRLSTSSGGVSPDQTLRWKSALQCHRGQRAPVVCRARHR